MNLSNDKIPSIESGVDRKAVQMHAPDVFFLKKLACDLCSSTLLFFLSIE